MHIIATLAYRGRFYIAMVVFFIIHHLQKMSSNRRKMRKKDENLVAFFPFIWYNIDNFKPKEINTMRMRRKKHGAERIAACSQILIPAPISPAANPQSFFANEKPVCLEIGCGKGDFAVGMSAKHQDLNFIAMERVPDVACLALEKAMAASDTRDDNLRFLIGDARNLTEYFVPHSFDRIYLNFSDPWPKKGHAKRRLTHRGFLEIYKNLLKEDGVLRLKTDNVGLFDFSLEEFEAIGATVLWQTRDLHTSEKNADNIMTEYEKNFSEKGFSICSAWVKFN